MNPAMHPTHQIRRIVTGHDGSGKAIIESDGICPHVRVREGAGFVSSLLWGKTAPHAPSACPRRRTDRSCASSIFRR
jgi:hypothetical protein